VVEYQAEWPECFRAECTLLKTEIGDITTGIEHVGSTAVPGLPAKPILDIAAAVGLTAVIPDIVLRLAQHGYIDLGFGEGGYLLVKQSLPDVSTVHLHLVEAADPQWGNYLAFRDALRRNPALRERYSQLKCYLAEKHRDDRESYTAGKHDFIRAALAELAFPTPADV